MFVDALSPGIVAKFLYTTVTANPRHGYHGHDEEVNELHIRREEFLSCIVADQSRTDNLNGACKWFTQYLEHKFGQVWVSQIRPSVFGLAADSRLPSAADLEVLYQVLSKVARQLYRTENLALVKLVDNLVNDGSLIERDDGRRDLRQLVFIWIGWLSVSRLVFTQSV